MKKTLFFLGLLLSFAFLNAQNSAPSPQVRKFTPPVKPKTEIPALQQLQVSDVPPTDPTRDGWLTWANDPVASVVGANGINMAIFHRYAVSDLADYVGTTITKVKYMPYNHTSQPTVFTANPKIQIYEGGSVTGGVYNPGTLAVDYTVPSYTFNSEQTVELPTPYTITGTQEVWIGIYYSTTAGYPGCSTDGNGTGSYLEGKSNIFFVGGTYNEWGPSSEMFNPPSNKHCWTHAAYVVAPVTECDPATNLNVDYSGDCSEAVLTWNEPAKGTRDVILSEGFESGAVPTGWTLTNTSTASPWQVVDGLYDNSTTPPTQMVWAHGGTWFATNLWSQTSTQARNAWLFSKGFALTAGESYNISFWLQMTGYDEERDQLEVKIGQAANAAGMTTTIYSNTSTAVNDWTKMEYNFTATASGTYYLGFHAMTPAGLGNDIDIDDVLITSGSGPIPGDFTYNVYRDGTIIGPNVTTNTFTDNTFDKTVGHKWDVKVVCETGGESNAVSKTMGACDEGGDCNPATNLAVEKVGNDAKLTWSAPAKGAAPVNVTIVNDEIQVVTEPIEKITTGSMQRALSLNRTPVNNTGDIRMTPAKGSTLTRGTFVEDVESHVDFTINSTVNGWSYIDVDGSETYGFDGISFPNSGELMAYMVFNPTVAGVSGMTAHSGSRIFASFAAVMPAEGGLGPNNDWLISPELNEPTKLSFWAKTYTATYGLERMKVGYSTTGTAQSNFTFLTASPYVQVPATAWTFYEYDLPAGTKYIAINCVSSDAFVFMVDDITIEQSGADPVKYNIYRDGELVKANHTSTTYTDAGVNFTIDHEWCVKVACPTGGESVGICELFEAISTCDPATNLTVTILENCTSAELTWVEPANPPAGIEDWAKYCVSDDVKGRLGYSETSGADMTAAIRFTPSDLNTLGVANGQKITKVALGVGADMDKVTSMELRIWEGGTSVVTPGTLKYTQPITNYATFTPNAMNEVTLTTPFVIDASKELRIGYRLVNTSGYPIGRDAGPVVAEKGDLFFLNGSWMVTSQALQAQGWNYNFTIKAWVEGEAITLYNIYRNDVLIKENHAGISYTNTGLAENTSYTWSVAVVCGGGLESDLISKDAKTCVGVNEYAKTTFSIVPNPATSGSIKITSQTNFNTVELISFLGQTVLSQPNAGSAATIDVSNLPNGVYFVRLISEQGTSVQKFVKQ